MSSIECENKKRKVPVNQGLLSTLDKHETGFEPATLALARRYSSTEPVVQLLSLHFSSSKTPHTLKTTYCTIYSSKPCFLTPQLSKPRSSPRPISNGQLRALLRFHLRPIYLVVFKGPYFSRMGYLILRGASRLDAFSVYPLPAWLLCHGMDFQQIHQRPVRPGPLVLRTAPLKYPAPAPDRDRTVSRRSEPSSRTALMGEQPNPWNLLQLQDAMSRHRGAKPLRRCELLGVISLLSPG